MPSTKERRAFMSPICFELLSAAYDSYLKTHNAEFAYDIGNSDTLYCAITAIPSLLENGYITDVPDFILSDQIDIANNDFVTFKITPLALEYMRTNGKP